MMKYESSMTENEESTGDAAEKALYTSYSGVSGTPGKTLCYSLRNRDYGSMIGIESGMTSAGVGNTSGCAELRKGRNPVKIYYSKCNSSSIGSSSRSVSNSPTRARRGSIPWQDPPSVAPLPLTRPLSAELSRRTHYLQQFAALATVGSADAASTLSHTPQRNHRVPENFEWKLRKRESVYSSFPKASSSLAPATTYTSPSLLTQATVMKCSPVEGKKDIHLSFSDVFKTPTRSSTNRKFPIFGT